MNFSKKPKFLTCLECVDSKSYFNTYTINLSAFKAANFMKNGWHHHISEIRIQNLGKSVGCYICKMETTPKCSSCLSGVLPTQGSKNQQKKCNKNAMKNGNLKIIFHI